MYPFHAVVGLAVHRLWALWAQLSGTDRKSRQSKLEAIHINSPPSMPIGPTVAGYFAVMTIIAAYDRGAVV